MNISRTNFSQTLPFIYECLQKSHFVAVDFEMTGITAHSKLRNSNLDSVIKNFLILLFKITEDSTKILERKRKCQKISSNPNGTLSF